MFFKWLAKRISKAHESEMLYPAINSAKMQTAEDDSDNDPIRFELTTAVGGRILRVRRYDRRNHESDCQTYVIPQGEDVGERVTKIVNLELIK